MVCVSEPVLAFLQLCLESFICPQVGQCIEMCRQALPCMCNQSHNYGGAVGQLPWVRNEQVYRCALGGGVSQSTTSLPTQSSGSSGRAASPVMLHSHAAEKNSALAFLPGASAETLIVSGKLLRAGGGSFFFDQAGMLVSRSGRGTLFSLLWALFAVVTGLRATCLLTLRVRLWLAGIGCS